MSREHRKSGLERVSEQKSDVSQTSDFCASTPPSPSGWVGHMVFYTGQYYHLYNRGNNRQPIFLERENTAYRDFVVQYVDGDQQLIDHLNQE